jgi:hypothetical protein
MENWNALKKFGLFIVGWQEQGQTAKDRAFPLLIFKPVRNVSLKDANLH